MPSDEDDGYEDEPRRPRPKPGDEKREPQSLPSYETLEFQSLVETLERLFMNAKFSRDWVARHDYALAFIEVAATLLADAGDEEDSLKLWDFLTEYERPRIRTYLSEETSGPMKFEELGIKVKGGASEVPQSQALEWYDRLSQKLFADSYTQKLSKVMSEVQLLLVKKGILRRRTPRLAGLSFFDMPEPATEADDEQT